MFTYQDIQDKLSVSNNAVSVTIEGLGSIDVKQYLPIVEKGQLINDVIKASIDYKTNAFSPLRLEVYFNLYLLKYYAGIEAPMTPNEVGESFDLLHTNGIIDKIIAAIPEDEYQFLQDLTDNTVEDMTQYNYSLAGMVGSMSQDANSLEDSMKAIVEDIRSEEGKQAIDIIKNMGGSN